MKHLTILVPEVQNDILSIAAVYELFGCANAYFEQIGGTKLFKIELAGLSAKVDFEGGLFTVAPHVHISAISKTDLVIVPSLSRCNFQRALEENRLLIAWLAKQYKAGAEIASLCTGAFMLAAAGLLDGKRCATHWVAADPFREMFPDVNLQSEKLITDQNGIYTNGGAYCFLNLVLYLLEKYYGRPTAIHCSRIFEIKIDHQLPSGFTIFRAQKSHADELVRRAQAYIENNIRERISVKGLASGLAVSRRQFDRRFLRATGNTAGQYLQRVRIEAAKKIFETTRKSISQVMEEVGYSDNKAFRAAFKNCTGLLPLHYKRKYNMEATHELRSTPGIAVPQKTRLAKLQRTQF
jgi:transcriptional regulator GlxA family with amidase domain